MTLEQINTAISNITLNEEDINTLWADHSTVGYIALWELSLNLKSEDDIEKFGKWIVANKFNGDLEKAVMTAEVGATNLI